MSDNRDTTNKRPKATLVTVNPGTDATTKDVQIVVDFSPHDPWDTITSLKITWSPTKSFTIPTSWTKYKQTALQIVTYSSSDNAFDFPSSTSTSIVTVIYETDGDTVTSNDVAYVNNL